MEKQILVRTTAKIHARLAKKAKEKRWSVNTLINAILEDAVKKDQKKMDKNLV
jgi:predicted HicB family RNase H-like nuclease